MEGDRPTDELIQRMLSAVVGSFGGEEQVARLVGAARAEAEAEVKELLKAAVKATLLQRAVAWLESGSSLSEVPIPDAHAVAPAAPESLSPDTAPFAAEAAHATGSQGMTACYVYGMVRAGREPNLPRDLAGIDPRAPLRFVRQGDVAALASDISLDEFGPEAMAERVKDLRWVEEKVRAHDRVVKHLLAAGAVVPCRFGMVLRGEDDLRNLLGVHAHEIVATLDTRLNTRDAQAEDPFTMTVISPGQFQGARIDGRLLGVDRAGRVTGRADLTFDFDRIRFRNGRTTDFDGTIESVRTPDGDTLHVENTNVGDDESQTSKTATRTGIGAAIGAVIGAVTGGTKGAVIGATVGGAAGAGSVIVQGRDDLNLEPGSEFTIRALGPR